MSSPTDILKAAHLQYLRQTSTMPDIELVGIAKNTKYDLKTTNGITNAICKYIKYVGGFANRINTTGRKIKAKSGKEIFIKGTTKRGTPDVDCVYNSMSIKIEIKNRNTKDRISHEQSKVRKQLEAAGAIYFIAESVEDFLLWWKVEIESKTPAKVG